MTSNERVRAAVEDLQAGRNREVAFQVLYETYFKTVLQFIMSKGIEREEARELTQDCFKNLLRGVLTFRGDASVRTYVFAIAENLVRNRVRSRRAAKRDGEEVSLDELTEARGDHLPCVEAEDASDPLDELIQRQELEQVLECIGRLPTMPRSCLILRVVQGRSYKEIAILLDISVGTVGAHIFEARKRLRKMLMEPDAGAPGDAG
jgi:RNA polymerase sigma-70 factor (ECF subfamily)